MLRIETLGRRFGRNIAVETVSLSVPHGQMVGIIGPAGAGKSTLLRLVGRLIDPTKGRIVFDDVDVAQLCGRDLRAWRSDCAVIGAQIAPAPQLSVMGAVLAGVMAGLPQWRAAARLMTPRERGLALAALTRMGMAHAAHQRMAVLSAAGQRRVALARALAQRPKLLLADDLVADLDHAQALAVLGALGAVNRQDGLSVICSLPDPEIARATCARIIGLRDGRVVFDGTPDQLGPAQLREIYGHTADVPVAARPLELVSAA
jgi:phosphonate transport system ATP-binding protein